ncbi:MAG: hypothetical protein GVY04_11625 [Cyanobacteria bacterium]|jgi:pyruvate/2-oxoglutarate dehydrogenase complex dihydrolipoamide dehydrogenase (E3) component|nr:hypothetical protein [Cyanobacteria bacterium GSL.Bin1]
MFKVLLVSYVIEEAGFLTNEQVFSLKERPESLAVIGAGPIGCELGQAFPRYGKMLKPM